jgi:hypothetical protein
MSGQTANFLVMGTPPADVDAFIQTLTGGGTSLTVGDDLTIELIPAYDEWRNLFQAVIGAIILVDGRNADLFPDVQPLIDSLRAEKSVPVIVAVTGQEFANAQTPNDLRAHLPEDNPHKVFPCILSQKTSVENVLLALIYQILS